MSQLLIQALIALGVVAPVLVGGLFARRRSRADVEVTLSAEAREWAKSFMEDARAARENAAGAEARAEEQMAAMRARMDRLERYINTLEGLLRQAGIDPPSAPWGGGAGE